MGVITNDATRRSTVLAAFFERYSEADPRLDNLAQPDPLFHWCTCASLFADVNFLPKQGKYEFLELQDGRRNMLTSNDVLGLAEKLGQTRSRPLSCFIRRHNAAHVKHSPRYLKSRANSLIKQKYTSHR